MSRKLKRSNQPKMGMNAISQEVYKSAVLDSFQNVLARTGVGTPNIMEATAYPVTRYTKDYNLLNSLYRNSWLVRRICDTIPKDMIKNWAKVESDITPEAMDVVDKTIKLSRLRASLLQGLTWGRLYGGAVGMIMLEGQEDVLDDPLDVDDVFPGDFKGLMILDRWSGVYPLLELVSDISNPDFGLPEFYEVRDKATSVVTRIHHSRVIRFTGEPLPDIEMQAESYWGASIIESVFDELKKRDNTSANIAGIVFRANINVLKMNDLGELIGGTNGKAWRDIHQTIQAQNWLMNNFSMYLMSQEDDFVNINSKFEGLDKIYETFMMDLSGASQIPMTKLFGRSPAGMNATGESDLRNYYDLIEQEQEAHLRPIFDRLLPIICMSALGAIPDDVDIEFNPVETPSEQQIGEVVKWKVESLGQMHDRGILSDQLVLKELKQLSQGTGIFTNISDDDINNADTTIGTPSMVEGGIGEDINPQFVDGDKDLDKDDDSTDDKPENDTNPD